MTPQHFKYTIRFCSGEACLRLLSSLLLLCSGHLLARAASELPPLNTVPGSPRLPGKFVWADLVTDDAAAARKFYAQLLGWTFQDKGGYLVAANADRPLAGIFQRARPSDRPQAKPRWFGYISVPSVERVQRAVIKSGGRVLAAPQKMPNRGEQAVFADPEGAVFGVVRSSTGDLPDFLPDPGDWIWCELLSRDARKAGEFYRAVAGYNLVENDASPRPGDYVLVSRGYARAAALTLPKEKAQTQPTWLLFVRVKSVNDCVVRVTQLGGKVLLTPNPQLFNSKLAVIADPTGAEVGIMEWSENLVKGAQQ